MNTEIEEKPRVGAQEEAPARSLVAAVTSAAVKQNKARADNSSLIMLQQANQLTNITGSATPPSTIPGLSASGQSSVPASASASTSHQQQGAQSTSSTMGDYTNIYHMSSVLNQENQEPDIENSYDDGPRDREELREQDRFLPIANVARIMKKAIPETGKIAKDAKECVQECVSEFISFITSEASERCQQEKRKTINGEDILFAMTTLGFDNYVEPLKVYLTKYRESLKGEKVINVGEYQQGVEGEDSSTIQSMQYQIATNSSLHPSMVTDGYVYTQAQVNPQLQSGIHFNT